MILSMTGFAVGTRDLPGGTLTVETCSACHPFYTGKQRILDTGGRVARFEKRFGKRAGAGASADQ